MYVIKYFIHFESNFGTFYRTNKVQNWRYWKYLSSILLWTRRQWVKLQSLFKFKKVLHLGSRCFERLNTCLEKYYIFKLRIQLLRKKEEYTFKAGSNNYVNTSEVHLPSLSPRKYYEALADDEGSLLLWYSMSKPNRVAFLWVNQILSYRNFWKVRYLVLRSSNVTVS